MRLPPLLAAGLGSAAAAAEEGTRSTTRLGAASTPQVLEAIAGLVLVLALILVLGWAVRRFAHLPGAGKGLIRVLGGVTLGSRERAVVVAVGGTRLLLGVAPGQVRMLHVLPQDGPAGDSFGAQLDAARNGTAP
jgi:flagellar protein FliO/FliZ